jgi:hypothetical protein
MPATTSNASHIVPARDFCTRRTVIGVHQAGLLDAGGERLDDISVDPARQMACVAELQVDFDRLRGHLHSAPR